MPYSQLILTDASTDFPQMLMSIANPTVATDKQGYCFWHICSDTYDTFYLNKQEDNETTKIYVRSSLFVPDKQEQPLWIRS